MSSVSYHAFKIIKRELPYANPGNYYMFIYKMKELGYVNRNIRYLKCTNIKSISALSPFVNLRKLNLVCCNGITDILVLSTPVNLIKLNISVLASSVSMRYQSRIPSHEI